MNYTIDFVYQNLSDDLKKRIIDFWISEGALNDAQAQGRVDQVALIVKILTRKSLVLAPVSRIFIRQ